MDVKTAPEFSIRTSACVKIVLPRILFRVIERHVDPLSATRAPHVPQEAPVQLLWTAPRVRRGKYRLEDHVLCAVRMASELTTHKAHVNVVPVGPSLAQIRRAARVVWERAIRLLD